MNHASINRIYRVVFNEITGTYVAVPEFARRAGPGASGKAMTAALLGALLVTAPGAQAQIQPVAGTLTNVYNAPNGVPVVNINKANSNGLSHNQYNQYNVDTRGVVLNNGNTSQMARSSQLAGQVMANTNLVQEARVILNEVVAPNRTTLAGFTEVLGSRADVIVANPYGITCSGCGFLNTDRVTLTTGVPTFDAAKLLKGFAVSQGDLLITGNGLNGNNQTLMELVARGIKAEAAINTPGVLRVVVGTNQWNLDNTVTALTPGAGAPLLALDTATLGGMYAGQIRIVSTETGLGVRMAGDMSASAGDIRISAEGRISGTNNLSAAGQQVVVEASQGMDLSGNVSARQVNLSSQQDVTLRQGKLVADELLAVSAASLNDVGMTAASKAQRFGQTVTLNTTGAASVANAVWGAQGNQTVTVGGAATLSNADLYAKGALAMSTGSLGLQGTSQVSSTAAATVSSTGRTDIAAGSTLQGQALLTVSASTVGNLGTLQAKALQINGNLDNGSTGTVASEGALNLSGTQLTNQGKVMADTLSASTTSLNNSGTLQGRTVSLTQSGQHTNSGTVVATGNNAALSVQANGLSNSGKVASDGNTTLSVSGTLNNTATGQVTGQAIGVTATTVSNAGLVDAAKALTVGNASTQSLTNTGALQGESLTAQANGVSNQGKMLAQKAVQITSRTSAIGNTSTGTIQGTSVTLSGGLDNAGLIKAKSATALASEIFVRMDDLNTAWANQVGGRIESDGSVRLRGTQGTQAGTVNAMQDIALGDALRNLAQLNISGTVISQQGRIDALVGTGGTTVSGTVQAKQAVDLSSSGAFSQTSTGAIVSTDANVALGSTQSTLTLSGKTTAGQQASLSSTSGTTTDSNAVVTAQHVHVQGGAWANSGKVAASDRITSTATLTNQGLLQALGQANGTSAFAQVSNQSAGRMVLANTTFGNSNAALDNQGRISSTGNISGTVSSLTNGSGSNHTAAIVAAKALSLSTPASFTNEGALFGGESLSLSVTNGGSLTNSANGGIAGSGTVQLSAAGTFTNSGTVYGATSVTVNNTQTIVNQAGADLSSDGNVSLAASGNLRNHGAITANGNITLSAGGSFTNETQFNGVSISKAWKTTSPLSKTNRSTLSTEGSLKSGMNVWLDTYTSKEEEELVGITEQALDQAVKAQIVGTGSNSTVTISYGSSGLNKVATITAPNVSIGGSGTFTNDDMSLLKRDSERQILLVNDNGEFDDENKIYAMTNVSGSFNRPNGSESSEDYNPGSAWTQVWGTSDDDWSGQDEINAANDAVGNPKNLATHKQFNAGIKANNFSFTSGTLNNVSSPFPTDTSKVSTSASLNTSGIKTQSGSTDSSQSVQGASTVSGPGATLSNGQSMQAASAVNKLTFGGVNFNLPTNPNGLYVVSQNPKAGYLIESNPQFALQSDFVGSQYMAERFGINPDMQLKRLGDASYEAYMIRQQVINATGSALIGSARNEATQMQAMMDAAISQGKSLGLTYGKPLTAAQIAKLDKDMVWMEEVVVNGQKVLAPRVYLAPSTLANLTKGASIVASEKATIQGDALTNTGGTIQAKNLDIKAGSVTNTSGTIDGTESARIEATKGSVVNQTVANTTGNAAVGQNTSIGKTATMGSSKGNLTIKAAENITVKGGQVNAGRNASLEAGKAITVDTIQNKTTSFDADGTSTKTVRNVGSGINVGGNLGMKAKDDITVGGSNVNVKGNASIQSTTGSVKVVDRVDTRDTETRAKVSESTMSDGSLYSKSTTKTVTSEGKSQGSSITVGGNTSIQAAKDLTLQGSSVDTGGKLSVKATDVNVKAGQNYSTSTTTTTTMSIGKIDKPEGSAKAGAEAGGSKASASANAKGSAGVNLTELDTQTTSKTKITGSASSLKSGGGMAIEATNALNVEGSNIDAGGDLAVKAKSVNVTTFKEVDTTTTTRKTEGTGIYTEGEAKAEASASKGGGKVPTGGRAKAEAEATGTTTIGSRNKSSTETETSITNLRSSIKSGGNMSIKADETASFHGADVSSGGDMTIQAKDIINTAAEDSKITTSSSSTELSGVYIDGTANANAKGSGNAKNAASVNGSASASAEASAGLRAAKSSEMKREGETTMKGSTFTSGGNLTRKAENKISDQGSALSAEGNIEQSAKKIVETRAENTKFSESSSSSIDGRIGVSAGASAGASGGVTGGDAGAGTSVGVKAKLDESASKESSKDTTQQVTTYKAGGKIKSTSQEETVLLGTQMKAGKGVEISGGSVDIQAARDTSTSSKDERSNSGEAKVGTGGVDLAYKHGEKGENKDSSTAKGASIDAGAGGLVIRARTGDVTLEGSELSGASATIKADQGAVNLKAATSTDKSSTMEANVDASLSASKDGKTKEKSGSVGLSADYAKGQSAKTTQQGVKINTTGNTSIEAAKDVTLQGTSVDAGGNVGIQSTGGKVKTEALRNTESNSNVGASIDFNAGGKSGGDSGGGGGGGGGLNVDASIGSSNQSTVQGVQIKAGGSSQIKAQGAVELQNTQIDAGSGSSVQGQSVNRSTVQGQSSSTTIHMDVGGVSVERK
ncbi:filamentous hemagglutinin N-terminal domain-containing protein [Aquabacterium lacunae]|uniref:Filamentous hemagglutinin N-terminal domain-containing protein n=1 Tax=Aquabacterium lacunae TaxID=2528630 RepID=A0A4Q9H2S2_9BURK|nr:hemagglutinin repeat-containing protein [Aquabacterium lacunae]TBO29382.1 filamentous hemagglutinin N-terminal domain-containing protein [Aquabacterium lacunae]